jgi:PHD/YefM family antitoxin component YafN of YafNO toxin-antitoxin module
VQALFRWHLPSPAVEGQPVYLTKNGRGFMVLLDLKSYAELTDPIEAKLDEADLAAVLSDRRLSHDEVFGQAKNSQSRTHER